LGAALVLLLLWTTAGRALSATWTAPPPMIAPPAVQAHNLASAIRTDMKLDPPYPRALARYGHETTGISVAIKRETKR